VSNKVKNIFAVIVGGLVLLWPGFFNGYPIVFSDTNVFIAQPAPGYFNWDKPFVYGPWMLLFHGWQSLWPVCVAHGLIVSHLLWLAASTLGVNQPLRHVLVCCVLALLSSAAWFVSFLMPDIFAPVVVLCLFILAFYTRLTRALSVWLVLLTAFAMAVHLSHLVIAAACLLPALVLSRRRVFLLLAPLVLALSLLVSTSYYAFSRLAVSPFGSVFFLARLAGDGHIDPVLREHCETRTWSLCKWQGRLPSDSDEFLWRGDGPVWSHPGGPMGLAPEASELIALTLRAQPLAALQSSLVNMWQQLWLFDLGDTLVPVHLEVTVGRALQLYFPPGEYVRFEAGRQMSGSLDTRAKLLSSIAKVAYGVFLLLTVYLLWDAIRRKDLRVFALIAMIWFGLAANALVTGALSKPQHRYQARIIWLLAVPSLLLFRAKGAALKSC